MLLSLLFRNNEKRHLCQLQSRHHHHHCPILFPTSFGEGAMSFLPSFSSITLQFTAYCLPVNILFYAVHLFFFWSTSTLTSVDFNTSNYLFCSSLRITSPYQVNLMLLNFSSSDASFRLSVMQSFLTLSILVTTHMHLNIHISATRRCLSFVFFIGQHSDLLVCTTGPIIVLFVCLQTRI